MYGISDYILSTYVEVESRRTITYIAAAIIASKQHMMGLLPSPVVFFFFGLAPPFGDLSTIVVENLLSSSIRGEGVDALDA